MYQKILFNLIDVKLIKYIFYYLISAIYGVNLGQSLALSFIVSKLIFEMREIDIRK